MEERGGRIRTVWGGLPRDIWKLEREVGVAFKVVAEGVGVDILFIKGGILGIKRWYARYKGRVY